MFNRKNFIIVLFVFFSSFVNCAYAETLNFGASTYEGDVKKGKAHGIGIFTFADGSKYEGKFKKNTYHGKGKYTDYCGSYHITLTLPYSENIKRSEFIRWRRGYRVCFVLLYGLCNGGEYVFGFYIFMEEKALRYG